MSKDEKTAPPRRRAQADRRAKSDRRMLRAAQELIARKGASGVSMAEIGQAAGFSRGLPAERFGSKVALLLAVIDFSDHWFNQRLAEALQGKRGLAALVARINTHMEGVRDTATASLVQYQLSMESFSTLPELRTRISALGQSYRDGFRLHLAEAEEMGELRDGVDHDQTATLIVGTMRGVAMQALIDGNTEELERARHYLPDMFLRDLARTGPAGQNRGD